MQTNNTLYEKKHHYMLILKELDILKNQTDHEVLNEGLPKVRAQEIHDIYTRTIVGLLEEGLSYQYIKDANDSKKDRIRIKIDGSVYDCRNIDIREVLEDRYDSVMNLNYAGPSLGEIQQARRKNEDPTLKNNNDDVKQLISGLTDAIKSRDNEKKDKSEEKNSKKDNADMPNPIQSYIPPKVYINPSDEKNGGKESKVKSMIHTFVNIGIFAAIVFGVAVLINNNPVIKNGLHDGVTTIINQITGHTDEPTENESEVEETSVQNDTMD